MTRDPLTQLSTRATPQSEPADPRQRRNNAGGFTFTVGPWDRLRRFLTLGVDGGTYYVRERDLALDNLRAVHDLIDRDARRVVDEVVAISEAGRAPRQQPGLFTLAATAALANEEGRRAAFDALPRVARTGSTLKTFVRYMEQFRGWGRAAKRGVGAWYLDRDVAQLAYQAVKYRTRVGWSDRDVLRLAHPRPAKDDVFRRELFDWMCGRRTERLGAGSVVSDDGGDPLRIVEGFEQLQRAEPRDYARIVGEFRLPWEALPDEAKTREDVWRTLVERDLLPATALLRQLPTLTRRNALTGDALKLVVERLQNVERLRRGRVHPVSVLLALRTYALGHSFQGSSTWQPNRRVIDALDAAFYAAFGAIEPTGKRVMLALDVSGSMGGHVIRDSGDPRGVRRLPITPRDASAAIALATLNVEDDCDVYGFGDRFDELTISPRQRLDDVVRSISRLPFQRTDCALPMQEALRRRLQVDTFVVYTDNETWYGGIHPHQALRQYRESTGIAARLVVVGMAATEFTIADPTDAGMLDVAGFDSAVPNVISDFARGEVG